MKKAQTHSPRLMASMSIQSWKMLARMKTGLVSQKTGSARLVMSDMENFLLRGGKVFDFWENEN